MSTRSPVIRVADFDVDVVRKDVKNLHVGVYPPVGRVRVAAPPQLDDEAVRLAVVARLSWVNKQRKKMLTQPRQTKREMAEGESHYVWGRPYRLRVIQCDGPNRVRLTPDGRLELAAPVGLDSDHRSRVLAEWYRRELRSAIPPLISKWASALNVPSPDWGIRRMKTKWGSCSATRGRIWLNLELAHKAPRCLEYLVVHEMVHLLERNHTDRFFDLMNDLLPPWQSIREELNGSPLSYQEWSAPFTTGDGYSTRRSMKNGVDSRQSTRVRAISGLRPRPG